MTFKFVAGALLSTVLFGSNVAFAESRVVMQAGDFELIEFYDGFDNKIDGYAISNGFLRFDKYGSGDRDFVLLELEPAWMADLAEFIEDAHRSLNPSWPEDCDWSSTGWMSCRDGAQRIEVRVRLKIDDTDPLDICGNQLDEAQIECSAEGVFPDCLIFASNSADLAWWCREKFMEPLSFFLPTDVLIDKIVGDVLRVRFELHAVEHETSVIRSTFERDFPLSSVVGLKEVIAERESRVLESFR